MCRLADVRGSPPGASWQREVGSMERRWNGQRCFVRLASKWPERGTMIRVSVEVCSGSSSFRAAVWAKDIEQALSLTRACYPGGEAKVVFPIEPEDFFVKELVLSSGMVHPEMPERAAG
jgi:hypothetical protein